MYKITASGHVLPCSQDGNISLVIGPGDTKSVIVLDGLFDVVSGVRSLVEHLWLRSLQFLVDFGDVHLLYTLVGVE